MGEFRAGGQRGFDLLTYNHSSGGQRLQQSAAFQPQAVSDVVAGRTDSLDGAVAHLAVRVRRQLLEDRLEAETRGQRVVSFLLEVLQDSHDLRRYVYVC